MKNDAFRSLEYPVVGAFFEGVLILQVPLLTYWLWHHGCFTNKEMFLIHILQPLDIPTYRNDQNKVHKGCDENPSFGTT